MELKNGVKEWKVEKILNKRKIREVTKYLVQWKKFIIKHNIQKKDKDLENIKEIIVEFKKRLNMKVKQ